MSLPSRMMFYNDNDKLIVSFFINCGWVYEGRLSTLKVLRMFGYDFPQEFKYVKIYEETLTFDEFHYLLSNLDDEYLKEIKIRNENRTPLNFDVKNIKVPNRKVISPDELIKQLDGI